MMPSEQCEAWVSAEWGRGASMLREVTGQALVHPNPNQSLIVTLTLQQC